MKKFNRKKPYNVKMSIKFFFTLCFSFLSMSFLDAQILEEFNFARINGGFTNAKMSFYENVKMTKPGVFDFSNAQITLENKVEYNPSGYVTKLTSRDEDNIFGNSSVFNSMILIDAEDSKINRVELYTSRNSKKLDLLREHRTEYKNGKLTNEYIFGKNDKLKGEGSYAYGVSSEGNEFYTFKLSDNINQVTYIEKNKYGDFRMLKIYGEDTISNNKLVYRSEDNTIRKFLAIAPAKYGMVRDFYAMMKDSISLKTIESRTEGGIDSMYMIYREILDSDKNPIQSVISLATVDYVEGESKEFIVSASKTEYTKVKKELQGLLTSKMISGVWQSEGAGLEFIIENFDTGLGKKGVSFHYKGDRNRNKPNPELEEYKWLVPLREVFMADYSYNENTGVLRLFNITGIEIEFRGDVNLQLKIEDGMLLLSPLYMTGTPIRFIREL
jgi:hypothetical protein